MASALAALVTLLVVAIYLTRLSLPWTAFLTGILVAAVLSLVSRASRAEWIIARREAKIASLQEKLAREVHLRHEVEEKLAEQEAPARAEVVSLSAPADTHDPVQDAYVQSLSEQVSGVEDSVKSILSAIENDAFCLYFQSIVPLAESGAKHSHCEVLIRLIEEEEGMMPPGAFFPLIEKYGLMPRLDRWVVKHVIDWISSHPASVAASGHSVFFINIAAASLADRDLHIFIREQLLHCKVPPQSLCFEITEHEFSTMRDDVTLFVNQVRGNGSKIALCNFGRTGLLFKSLRGIAVDYIKIDGAMILDLMRDPGDLAQVTAIARVAKTIDVATIAEMVESDACKAMLKKVGVDYAQGFGIATPRPLAALR